MEQVQQSDQAPETKRTSFVYIARGRKPGIARSRKKSPFATRVEAAGLCPDALALALEQSTDGDRRLRSEIRQYLNR